MNNLDCWRADNEEYLANAMAWLRWRLCELAQLPDIEKPTVTEMTTAEGMNPPPALLLLVKN